MHLAYINPNSTQAMTADIVAAARAAAPGVLVRGWTNRGGPPAIEGAADGEAAVAGLRALLPEVLASGAEAIVLACFDDTGLAEIRDAAPVPVIGIGQAGFHMAGLLGLPFSVVTTLAVSVPVIEANVAGYGFAALCRAVRPSGIAVLELERPGEAVLDRLAGALARAEAQDAPGAIVLGCAGMAPLARILQSAVRARLIDGVAASAALAPALARFAAQPA